MGARVELELERAGFYPRGGGSIRVRIEPSGPLHPLTLHQRGSLIAIEATSLLGNLPQHIAARELEVVRTALGVAPQRLHTLRPACYGQGNALLITVKSERVTELFSSIGARGVPAESVAARAVAAVERYLQADVAVGRHMADQLLLPLALAAGGEFTTLAPDPHTTTNAAVIRQFLDRTIRCEQCDGERWLLRVDG
jgi:RNA 3'-terminal phosphate cyclase (ATP)